MMTISFIDYYRKYLSQLLENEKSLRWSNRYDVRCDCMYDVFNHRHATMYLVARYLL